MTNIFIFKKERLYCGFEIEGHASKETGDVLCACLSFVSINTYNSIEKICYLKKDNINFKMEDGYFKFYVDFKNIDPKEIEKIQTLFKSFEIGVISLKEEYNKYIEIYYKEV